MHTSPSGKWYIGITGVEPEERWQKGSGYQNNAYFTHAIKNYGWDNFQHEVLFAGLTRDEACDKEVELIRLYIEEESARHKSVAGLNNTIRRNNLWIGWKF